MNVEDLDLRNRRATSTPARGGPGCPIGGPPSCSARPPAVRRCTSCGTRRSPTRPRTAPTPPSCSPVPALPRWPPWPATLASHPKRSPPGRPGTTPPPAAADAGLVSHPRRRRPRSRGDRLPTARSRCRGPSPRRIGCVLSTCQASGCESVGPCRLSVTALASGHRASAKTCWRTTATTATFLEAVREIEEVVPVNVSTWVLPSGVTVGR